ncbi:MAG: hypothetical protein AAB408_04295 [Patescibacteria group bacterium]
MKKIVFVIAVLLLIPSNAFALELGTGMADNIADNAGYAADGKTTQTTFSETLGVVVRTALSLVGVIFLSLMVYAGFLWMNARGEESQIEKAQEIIKSSVIGLIITVGAYSITAFVLPRVLERTTGSSGGTVGSITVCCQYRPTTGPQAGLTQWQGVTSQTACTALCTSPNTNQGCAPDSTRQPPACQL